MDYSSISKNVREKILKMAFISQAGHIGSSLSIADILAVLYSGILKINPKEYLNESRDRFILSKGHAVLALYAVLAEKGFFSEEQIENYCKDGSKMPGHASRNSLPGIEVSTGSLGHGLPIACGISLSGKLDSKDYKVFVLMGDGEMDEGTTWEASLFASHHKLDNLTLIIDYNKLQLFGRTNDVLNLEPFRLKLESLGWSVQEVDGHNHSEIEAALSKVPFERQKPSCIIAHTVKGKGVSFMENRLEWHDKKLGKEDYQKALEELKN